MEKKSVEEKILDLSDGRQVKVQFITLENGHIHPEVDENDPFNEAQNITEDDYDLIQEALGEEYADK